MTNTYDFVVIGAGLSACTFASCLNKRFSESSILLIEHGRRLGGRATTRQSRKNKIKEFDHGLPSISFGKHISQDILSLISPLINSEKLVDISQDILIMDKFGYLSNSLTNYKIYRSLPFMFNFCKEIVNQAINPAKINFLFQTLTKSINFSHDLWEIDVNKGSFIKSKNLILSSSLIAHPRCLEIMNIDYIPLRKALTIGQDKVVDSLLQKVSKLTYIKRKVHILYVTNHSIVDKFSHKYLQIIFSEGIKKDLHFEKVIFTMQGDGCMIIALHCYYIETLLDMNIDKTIKSLISLFVNYPSFQNLISASRLVDTMDWRASQPHNHLLPKELQWSSTSKIGFCGDWFDWGDCTGVEAAMNSSVALARLLK